MIKKMNEHYSFTTPASVHDEEALTALELAGRTAAKVNEVVDGVNNANKKADDTLTEMQTRASAMEAKNDAAVAFLYAGTQQIPDLVEQQIDYFHESIPTRLSRLDYYAVYASHGTKMTYTPSASGGGVLGFSDALNLKNPNEGGIYLPWATYGDELGSSLSVSSDGYAATITLPQSHTALVYDTEMNKLRIRYGHNNILNKDVVLFEVGYNKPIGGCLLDGKFYEDIENLKKTGGGGSVNVLFFDSVDDLPSDLPDGTMAAVPSEESAGGGGLPVIEIGTVISTEQVELTQEEGAKLTEQMGKPAFIQFTANLGDGEQIIVGCFLYTNKQYLMQFMTLMFTFRTDGHQWYGAAMTE